MDVASVPFTVVTYSEPQCESAREISVSEGPASFPYLQANPAHQPVGRELNKQADAADVPSPFFEGDGSDSEADTASEGRGDAGDAQLALDLQQAEMRRSGLLPDDMQAGTIPELRTEDQELQHRLSTRLSDVSYAKHRPRVNSVDYRPEDFMTDRELLSQRLKQYGLCERTVKGDGNCQFRAVADQLYRTPHAHFGLRKAVVHRLRKRPELYSEYVPDDFPTYCRQMEKDGTWGDHVTLQAVSDLFGVKVYVLTSFPGSEFIEISPSDGKVRSQRILYVSFWAEIHYNSLYPASDPPRDLRHDKVLGSRRLHRLFHGKPDPTI